MTHQTLYTDDANEIEKLYISFMDMGADFISVNYVGERYEITASYLPKHMKVLH
jgi:hypothetical protein